MVNPVFQRLFSVKYKLSKVEKGDYEKTVSYNKEEYIEVVADSLEDAFQMVEDLIYYTLSEWPIYEILEVKYVNEVYLGLKDDIEFQEEENLPPIDAYDPIAS